MWYFGCVNWLWSLLLSGPQWRGNLSSTEYHKNAAVDGWRAHSQCEILVLSPIRESKFSETRIIETRSRNSSHLRIIFQRHKIPLCTQYPLVSKRMSDLGQARKWYGIRFCTIKKNILSILHLDYIKIIVFLAVYCCSPPLLKKIFKYDCVCHLFTQIVSSK